MARRVGGRPVLTVLLRGMRRYGCELPAMIDMWRSAWHGAEDALFGIATLAAGGSEGQFFDSKKGTCPFNAEMGRGGG